MSRAEQHVVGATAVVLAAGAGTRFDGDGHKLTAMLPATAERPRESVATRAIASAVAAHLGTVVVVTGRLAAADLDLADRALAHRDHADPDIVTVHNSDWSDGQMTSVRAGLAAVESLGTDVAVIGLADQPGITPSAWRAVAGAASVSTPIAVAVYGGRRANPVALHRSIWTLLPTAGDEGARNLIRLRPDLVCEVPCSGSPTDIDTAEDLRRWQSN